MTPRDDLDPQVVAQLRAALDDDADGAGKVDVERLWADVAAQVPARRRRHAVRQAALAGAAAVLVVGAVLGGVLGLGALDDGRSVAPASGGTESGSTQSSSTESSSTESESTEPATQTAASVPLTGADLLPAPERTPRSTAAGTVRWVLPGSCTVAAPDPAEMVTARDGAGAFGAEVDVAQVATFEDDDAAATELQRVRDALAACAADDTTLGVSTLPAPLDGVLAEVDAGTSAAVLQVGDAVVLVTADGPVDTLGGVRARVLDRADAVAAVGQH